MRWQVLDERGMPEVPRTESGVAIGPAEGVEQDNLITDLGLDQIGVKDVLAFAHAGSASTTWRLHFAVGTGSVPPAVTDTALNAEAQRAADSGAFSAGSLQYALTQDAWRAVSVATRLITMTSERNLTEFGFSPEGAGAIGIRELFRDSGGAPIPVSLLAGKSIRVDHSLTVDIPAPLAGIPATVSIDEYDAADNLVNSVPLRITHGGVRRTTLTDNALAQVFNVWYPNYTIVAPRRITAPFAYAREDAVPADNSVAPQASSSAAAWVTTSPPYVQGTHQRVKRTTFQAAEHLGAWYGFAFLSTANVGMNTNAARTGWLFLFDDPSSYIKASTDTLRVGIVSAWDRA